MGEDGGGVGGLLPNGVSGGEPPIGETPDGESPRDGGFTSTPGDAPDGDFVVGFVRGRGGGVLLGDNSLVARDGCGSRSRFGSGSGCRCGHRD